MTEICFNNLTAIVGVATVAVDVNGLVLETVTVTVFGFELTETCVQWKPGFRIKLEALLSSGLSAAGFNDLTTIRQQLTSLVRDLDLAAFNE